MKVNTSNINSIEDIKFLHIENMQIPNGYTSEHIYQCCACESYRKVENMYSHDWCKACYRYCLRCKFTGTRFKPWKDKKDRFM